MSPLLPMNEPRPSARRGEPVISLMCGAPSLTIGLVTLVLLASYLLACPIGPRQFYRIERFATLSSSSATFSEADRTYMISLVLPSPALLCLLACGLWCGGLGVYLVGRLPRRWPVTSLAGTITCGLALVLAWLLIAWAAIQ
jgi:hypothetical protein